MITTIGNSGFEYITKNISTSGRQRKLQCKIRDIKTKEVIKSFVGQSDFRSRSRKSDRPGTKPTYKFLGYDTYYYYLQISNGSSVQWGQIQSDGAVLKSDRSILTVIAFFPNYEQPKTNVPVKTPIVIKEPPNIPKIITVSKKPLPIITASPVIPVLNTPDDPVEIEEISWIQKINITIKKIINWMMKILNR